MTEKKFTNEIGIDIIQSNKLPQTRINEETGELETFHMVQNGNVIYVSSQLFTALDKKYGDVE